MMFRIMRVQVDSLRVNLESNTVGYVPQRNAPLAV